MSPISPSKADTPGEFSRLLQEKPLCELLPLCPKCGARPHVEVDHSPVKDALVVGVSCHDQAATDEISQVDWHIAKDAHEKLDLILHAVSNLLRFEIGDDTRPELRYEPRPEPKPKRMHRRNAPWNF